jgi:2-keto-3-deoxy-L-rhamnonate aldolase RhmA
MRVVVAVVAAMCAVAASHSTLVAQTAARSAAIELWTQGKPAFGVFVPNENVPPRPPAGAQPSGAPSAGAAGARPSGGAQGARPKPLYTKAGGEKLAANPLYDYVFLNLEGSYDSGAVKAIADGLRAGGAGPRKTLIVRIPPFHLDPAASRTRVREIVAAGGDGVTFPHVQNLDEARQILDLFRTEKIDVWSPTNPQGSKVAMMMIEDAGALNEARAFADLKGYSILACGIGSLTQALGGNREAAEAGTQKILAETKRVRLVNMLTATTQDVEKRVKEGFLGILAQGQNPDEAITLGRTAAGR